MDDQKIKVLIVEDENIIALDIKRTVKKLGYHPVGTISSAEKAIEIVRKEQPHIILMDINLKGKLNGIDAAQIIISEFNLPIIFLSALTDTNIVEQIKVISAAGHLSKPFEEKDLNEALSKALLHSSN